MPPGPAHPQAVVPGRSGPAGATPPPPPPPPPARTNPPYPPPPPSPPPPPPPRQFPSDLFYAGRLLDGVAGASRPAPAGFPWPRPDWPVAFVPVPGGREETEGASKANRAEADAVAAAVAGLLAAGTPAASVGVITPYAAQVV